MNQLFMEHWDKNIAVVLSPEKDENGENLIIATVKFENHARIDYIHHLSIDIRYHATKEEGELAMEMCLDYLRENGVI